MSHGWTTHPLKEGVINSQIQLFLKHVLKDLGTWCHTSTSQDLKRILARIEHEGLSFLTITLPSFGKDFERSLELGKADHDLFQGFPWKGGLPRFLAGFLGQVFDRSTGLLLENPNVDCIWAVRQLTLMFAKISLPCSNARVRKAMNGYLSCEDDVRLADERLLSDPSRMESFKRLANLLLANTFSRVDSDVYYDLISPKHGPGATADRLRGNAKWAQPVWTERLEEVFPHWIHLSSSWLLSMEKLDHVHIIEPEAEMAVKVITVPKTLKTPRIIAIEPTCMQYMQQGLLSSITDSLAQDDICAKIINGPSQDPNRVMARLGSQTGELATLDLSEASDRVSNLHVRLLLDRFPHLREGVDSCRSRKAAALGHFEEIPLAKFASMGSALTFPFEAMTFAVVIFYGIEQALNRQLTRRDLCDLSSKVRVFGDDIIVPKEYVNHVVLALESFGLKVNSNKSFWNGKFRESCGKEYYDGEDVSIVRLRSVFPTQRGHAQEMLSTISTRNQLYKAGLWTACRYLDTILEGLIPFPIVEETSPIQGRTSVFGYVAEAMHPTLHSPLVKGLVESSKIPASPLDDYGALLKCLSYTGDLPFADERHLERAGRPHTVDTKVRMAQPF